MYSPTPKEEISREEWETRLQDVKIKEEEMNYLVLDFLISEGFHLAAEQFMKATDTKYAQSSVIHDIKAAYLKKAYETLTRSFYSVLEPNPWVHFRVQRQLFIELIRKRDVEGALSFGKNIGILLETCDVPELLDELERSYSLLLFEDPYSSPDKELLNESRRLDLADEVNDEILKSQNRGEDSKISCLLQLLIDVQRELAKKIDYPQINISSDMLEDPPTPPHNVDSD